MNNEFYTNMSLNNACKCNNCSFCPPPKPPMPPCRPTTIEIGTTTTGEPGTDASVTNVGTPSNAILNFVIPAGKPGAATIAIGTTTTLPSGSNATVTNTGSTQNAILNFGIPTGPTGKAGEAATITVGSTVTGAPGTQAIVTNTGSNQNAILNFTIPAGIQGEKGDKGDTGETGAAGTNGINGENATITIGTTTTGEPGSTASITNSGTATNAILNFTIPAGAQGEVGPAGTNGTNGENATITIGTTTTGEPGTEAVVTNTGTDTNAILNFTIPAGAVGSTGPAGEKGDTGEAATITIGTTTTGEPGSEAIVTNTGTSTNAILNFTIPRGATGEINPGETIATLEENAALEEVTKKINELITNLTSAGFLK